jgi:hypothetical protein
VVGDATFKKFAYDLSAFPLLIERLLRYYPPTHVVYLYEAAIFPGCEPKIWPVEIRSLGLMPLTAGFTLYIPPAYPTVGDPAMYGRMTAMQSAASQTAGAVS